ncbi:DUF2141 domain-containing protein [Allosphingosinicella sp.]|jgi:uncharacterized protein (DUF2141 family)|uniref:DUF2141 domain-containing protein n=1 Tax=Allosphingosinicella sp. TaxID=2823234 RepID=UPI002EE0E33F
MKTLILASIAALALATPATAATLTVDLDGVRSAPGTLYVSVQTREQFMQRSGIAGTVMSAPQAGSHRFGFELPEGEYAISVWHDDNGNGSFDKAENFMPLDGWAMVNAAQLRGEPSFDQVKTVIGGSPAGVRLQMVYGR